MDEVYVTCKGSTHPRQAGDKTEKVTDILKLKERSVFGALRGKTNGPLRCFVYNQAVSNVKHQMNKSHLLIRLVFQISMFESLPLPE
jgi:hypothetical protein